jgi:iron complex transport system substrate-binding protein
MPFQAPRFFKTSLVLIASAVLFGCTAGASAPNSIETSVTPSFPLTVINCETEVSFFGAPERVLAIKSTSIEMLLALGLEDRLIGTAFSDGPIAESWSARIAGIPVIDSRVPSQEATLDLEPDLVYAGWESNVTSDSAGDRELLASLGINTYVSPSACQSPESQPDPLTFDHVFADIEEIGSIFDVRARSTKLVSELQARLQDTAPDDRGLTALWFSSGSDIPYVGGGKGAPQMIMDAAGLTNIASDIDASWSSMSWESIIDANPDVIVLVDSEWGTTEKKIGVLESIPAVASLSAVQQGNFLVLPFPTAEAGVRNVEAVEILLSQLKGLELR